MWSSTNKHWRSHTPPSTTEVTRLCLVICDLLKWPHSLLKCLLRSESQQSTFSPSDTKILHDVHTCGLKTCVCAIYSTPQQSWLGVSAFKHSHGNRTQPNPSRCPGVCVCVSVCVCFQERDRTNTHWFTHFFVSCCLSILVSEPLCLLDQPTMTVSMLADLAWWTMSAGLLLFIHKTWSSATYFRRLLWK